MQSFRASLLVSPALHAAGVGRAVADHRGVVPGRTLGGRLLLLLLVQVLHRGVGVVGQNGVVIINDGQVGGTGAFESLGNWNRIE